MTDLGIDGLGDAVQVGTGGNALVYKAAQTDLDREVAVKVLRFVEDEGVRRRFDRERRAMGRLSRHPGIVPIYDTGFTAAGDPYLVMPFFAKGSLEDRLGTPWDQALNWIARAADTMAYAHENGVLHRDLKPGNLILDDRGEALVTDFGISRLMAGAATQSVALTLTPAYAPPEAYTDREPKATVDVYSLAATLFALINGEPAFAPDGAGALAVMSAIANDPVPDLRHLAPAPVCEVIERAMAKRPEHRYPTMTEFSAALRRAAGEERRPTAGVAAPAPGVAPVAPVAAPIPPTNPTGATQQPAPHAPPQPVVAVPRAPNAPSWAGTAPPGANPLVTAPAPTPGPEANKGLWIGIAAVVGIVIVVGAVLLSNRDSPNSSLGELGNGEATPTVVPEEPTPTVVDDPDALVTRQVDDLYTVGVPPEWIVVTDPDRVEEILEVGSQATGIDEAQRAFLVATLQGEGALVAQDMSSGDNLIVLTNPQATLPTASAYETQYRRQFAQGDFTDVDVAVTETDVDGEAALSVRSSYRLSGVPADQYQLLISQPDGKVFEMTVTVLSGADSSLAEEIFDSFDILES